MKKLLALVLAFLMITCIALAEQTQPIVTIISNKEDAQTDDTATAVEEALTDDVAAEGDEVTALIDRAANLDLSSLTSSLDVASLASDFLGFAVKNVNADSLGGIVETIKKAIAGLTGDGLANFKSIFTDTIIPAVSNLLSGDSGILSSLSEAQNAVTGLLGGGEGGLLDSVTGLLGGGEGEGFDASQLLSAIGVSNDSGLSLENISGIWDSLKDAILGAIQ